jgi:hypothetical protein
VYWSPLSLPGQFLTAAVPLPIVFIQQLRSLPCMSDKTDSNQTQLVTGKRLQGATYSVCAAPPVSSALSPIYRGPYLIQVPEVRSFIL